MSSGVASFLRSSTARASSQQAVAEFSVASAMSASSVWRRLSSTAGSVQCAPIRRCLFPNPSSAVRASTLIPKGGDAARIAVMTSSGRDRNSRRGASWRRRCASSSSARARHAATSAAASASVARGGSATASARSNSSSSDRARGLRVPLVVRRIPASKRRSSSHRRRLVTSRRHAGDGDAAAAAVTARKRRRRAARRTAPSSSHRILPVSSRLAPSAAPVRSGRRRESARLGLRVRHVRPVPKVGGPSSRQAQPLRRPVVKTAPRASGSVSAGGAAAVGAAMRAAAARAVEHRRPSRRRFATRYCTIGSLSCGATEPVARPARRYRAEHSAKPSQRMQ